MESCLYEGVVYHQRLTPVPHRFQYRLYMHFLDLAEVPALVRTGLLSERRFAGGGFLRRDHFGDPRQPLAASVRDLVSAQTGLALDGPIRLLTQLRHFGYYFSPLNLFYCYGGDGQTLTAVVAEVQNTPWLERHGYVLWPGNQVGTECEKGTQLFDFRVHKSFHVSPFMGMELEYHWRVSAPRERLGVAIATTTADALLFQAALQLRRVPLSWRTQFALRCRYPLMPARITAAIYLEAFHLWRKKCPFYPHPKHGAPPSNLGNASRANARDQWPVSSGTG
jgi:DUF1365 family protein